jgi:hypothetical protein
MKMYGYDPKTKHQSSQWKTSSSPWPWNCTKFYAKQRWCLSLFSLKELLYIMNIFHKAKWYASTFFILKY